MFFKTQGTRFGAIVATNKGLEWALPVQSQQQKQSNSHACWSSFIIIDLEPIFDQGTQQTVTCSKSAIETLEKGVKYVKSE